MIALPDQTIFNAGDRAPEWLVVVEARSASARLTKIEFLQRCLLIERAEDRLLIGLDEPFEPAIMLTAANCILKAMDKPLRFLCAGSVLLP